MEEPLEIATKYYYWKLSMAYWEVFELEAYRDFAPFPDEGRILDLGCNDGTFGAMLTELINLDQALIGVDIDERALKKASQRSGVYARTLKCDASDLPFDDESFDAVFSNQVLHCIPEGPDKAIEEVSRVLKRNGVFICTIMIDHSIGHLYISELLNKMGFDGLASYYEDSIIQRIPFYSPLRIDAWKEKLNHNSLCIEGVFPFISGSAYRIWSILTLPPFRVIGILKYIPSRRVRSFFTYFIREIISMSIDRLSNETHSKVGDSVLIVARRV